MTKAWCIVGLPGSGKTHLAKRLAFELEVACVFDDIEFLSILPENGSVPNVVITDPNFCLDEVRQRANDFLTEQYDEIEWIFFENDPKKCLINVRHRNDGRKVEGLIKLLHKEYHPQGDTMPIWQPPNN